MSQLTDTSQLAPRRDAGWPLSRLPSRGEHVLPSQMPAGHHASSSSPTGERGGVTLMRPFSPGAQRDARVTPSPFHSEICAHPEKREDANLSLTAHVLHRAWAKWARLSSRTAGTYRQRSQRADQREHATPQESEDSTLANGRAQQEPAHGVNDRRQWLRIGEPAYPA